MFCFDHGRLRGRVGREKLGTKGQAADMSEKESKTSPDEKAPAKELTPWFILPRNRTPVVVAH